jgi:hypothetical protein
MNQAEVDRQVLIYQQLLFTVRQFARGWNGQPMPGDIAQSVSRGVLRHAGITWEEENESSDSSREQRRG